MRENACCSLVATRSSEGLASPRQGASTSPHPLPVSHCKEFRGQYWIMSEGHSHWGSLETWSTFNYIHHLDFVL